MLKDRKGFYWVFMAQKWGSFGFVLALFGKKWPSSSDSIKRTQSNLAAGGARAGFGYSHTFASSFHFSEITK
ncbi:MAG: hypothetical protein WCD79_19190 [Chthoniobacteraceae bacterium]